MLKIIWRRSWAWMDYFKIISYQNWSMENTIYWKMRLSQKYYIQWNWFKTCIIIRSEYWIWIIRRN